MSAIIWFLGWCVLLVFCWPVALLALVLLPIAWLIALPFRVAFIVVEAMLAFIKAVLFLPARLLGGRPHAGRAA
jgi:hypothetical protein